MRFLFSLFKPKKPKQKEDPMSEVQQHLAAIDEIYKVASFDLAAVAFRIIRSPEIVAKITKVEGEQLILSALNDFPNFHNHVRNTVAQVQQRGN